MKKWLWICVALCLMADVGQASTESLETMRSLSTRGTEEFTDLERQQLAALYNQKDCKEESRVEFSVNFVFLTAKGMIVREDIRPTLLIGTVCFVGGFSILHYLGVV